MCIVSLVVKRKVGKRSKSLKKYDENDSRFTMGSGLSAVGSPFTKWDEKILDFGPGTTTLVDWSCSDHMGLC